MAITAEMRKAIAPHHTATSTGAWDGPKNKARLKKDQDEAYYRKAFAWRDPDGDAKTKAGYKFIHHEIDADGSIDAAVVRACQTGIAVLNGARGGTIIPAADRKGVWRHLAAHLKDADVEPPELMKRSILGNWEERIIPGSLAFREIRAGDEDDESGKPTRTVITGEPSIFDSVTLIYGFEEVFRRGAFKKTLRESDIRALINHDVNLLLARTSAGTLELVETGKGLDMLIDPVPNTTFAMDAVENMRLGNLTGMSIRFDAIKQRWTQRGEAKPDLREIFEADLIEVSLATFPAYEDTKAGLDARDLGMLMARARAGNLLDSQRSRLIGYMEEIKELAAEDPDRKDQSSGRGEPSAGRNSPLHKANRLTQRLVERHIARR